MLIFSLDNQPIQAETLVSSLVSLNVSAALGECTQHHFPDGESYLNILSDVKDKNVIVVCQLHHPNDKLIDLMLFSETVKQQGARSVHLVAPYLAYMRQDIKFNPGECVTSRHVATWLSERFDSLITIDPHLHRYHELSEVYTIPNRVLHATDLMASYIQENIKKPLVIGPDSESEQWAKAVADLAGCDALVLNKIRHGDHDVEVSLPHLENYPNHQPVLIDDIISTGKTMLKAADNIVSLGAKAPVCIGVHAVFSQGALTEMEQGNIAEIVTCNTISHATNKISVIKKLAVAIVEMQEQLKEKGHV